MKKLDMSETVRQTQDAINKMRKQLIAQTYQTQQTFSSLNTKMDS